MAEYTELIKALRYCGTHFVCNEVCTRYHPTNEFVDDCRQRLIRDAAAAIEELEAEVRKYHDAFGRLSKTAVELEQRIAE